MEYASHHPHGVRLWRGLAGGNEVVSRCNTSLTVDNPDQQQLTSLASSGPFGSGSTRLGRSRKDGLPFRCRESIWRSKASTRARGQPSRCPLVCKAGCLVVYC